MQDNQDKKIIEDIKTTLEQMILGKECRTIEETAELPELNEITELLNILNGNLSEMNRFARNLAKGNLDIPIPSRRNYIAGTLKELHSQLSSFVWIVRQLTMGKIVDRLDYMGELSQSLNGLIDIIANYYSDNKEAEDVHMQFESPISSWQYHQVYLAFNHLSMMIIEIDENGDIIFSNKVAKEFLGGIKNLEEGRENPKLQNFVDVIATLSTESNTFPIYNEIYDKGSGLWFRITSDQIQFPNRQKVYIHTVEDISVDKNAVKELERNATTDYLTNVYNRSVGVNALESLMVEHQESSRGCAAFIDVDGLKSINDSYGHIEGDYAIKTISQVLLTSVRETDIVSRFGGDEFLVVFNNCSMEVAEQIITRMYARLDEINANSHKPYALSFSHGIVQINPEHHPSVKELILLMDKKMYERKRKKNRTFDNSELKDAEGKIGS